MSEGMRYDCGKRRAGLGQTRWCKVICGVGAKKGKSRKRTDQAYQRGPGTSDRNKQRKKRGANGKRQGGHLENVDTLQK